MKAISLHSKQVIENFLRKNIYLHLYCIGDLDDFYWNHTQWYALKCDDELHAIALLYTGLPLPTLLALNDNVGAMRELLTSILPILPAAFYTHSMSGLEDIFAEKYALAHHGTHYKMALMDKAKAQAIDAARVSNLGFGDLHDLLELYERSYPENWFDPRMLETGQYFGIREKGVLASVAGIHVYSEKYKVAALGNITTHPEFRGRRFGKLVTAKLCQSLIPRVEHIGLNVKCDNMNAIRLYKNLGFGTIAKFEEYMVAPKS